MNALSDPTAPASLSLANADSGSLLAALARRLFACNPFYLASAGVLLWGLNRLSAEPKLAGAESAQILFNFTALFAYEILWVVTAIFLARRTLWSDALVLVGLENLFVMIPFSLVSRAVLINQPLAREMCLAAALLAVAKFWSMKRFIPDLILPGRLLALGGAALGLNMTVALWLQRFANDRPTLHGWLVLAWLIAMPLLAGSVVFLPRSTPHSKLLPQRAWLPFAMFALWLVVTGFHLFGVGYVHVFPWRNALLAPTVLAVAWAVLLRTLSPDLNLNVTWRRVLLCGPVAAPFLALADTPIFFALHAFNALAYGLLAWKLRPARSALILAALSLVLATAGLSDSCLSLLGLARGEWALGTVALAGLVPILCSRDPRLGFLGAVGCAALAGLVVLRLDCSWHWAAQAGLVFVLVHSLRWPDKQFPGARHARYYLGPLWVFTSFHWIRSADPQSLAGCLIAGAIVLVCCLVCWLVGRHRPPLCVPVYAGCVTAMSPGLDLAEAVWKIPPGYLAVLGSLPLFVLGTILALLRPRWSKGDSPP